MKNILRIFLSVCLLVSGLAIGMEASASVPTEGYVNFVKLNDSTLKLEIENGKGYIDKNGTAFIKDSITGEVAELPQQTLDKDDNKVNLVYKQKGPNLIVEYHDITTNSIQARGFWKCTLGTAGGAGTGALAGMGIGAVAATPVTVLGGGVFGGISGGMTGAAASCFD